MEIRIVLVAFPLFYYHALVYKEFVQVHENIAPTFKADTCVTLFQGCDNIGIALHYILSKSVFQRFTVLLLRKFRLWKEIVYYWQ